MSRAGVSRAYDAEARGGAGGGAGVRRAVKGGAGGSAAGASDKADHFSRAGAGGAGSGAARRSAGAAVARRDEDKAAEDDAGSEYVELKDTFITYSNLPPMDFARHRVCVHSKIGRRKYQEDRFVVCPRLLGRDDVSFYGVFDGTVGDFASEFVHQAILLNCVRTSHFREALGAPTAELTNAANLGRSEAATREMYRKTDADLLRRAREKAIHYSASTSVTALVTGNVCTVGHLADSRIAIGRREGGTLVGKFLTHDHKPDQLEELARIEASGGSLTYLHGGKPFIRGGDFVERQAKGERPMQLNYSRAFGGKDLKPYGLSSEPDVTQVRFTEADKMLILASDGLWDVVDATTAVRRAWDVAMTGADPSVDLVDYALAEHDMRGSIDNCTVMVVFLRA